MEDLNGNINIDNLILKIGQKTCFLPTTRSHVAIKLCLFQRLGCCITKARNYTNKIKSENGDCNDLSLRKIENNHIFNALDNIVYNYMIEYNFVTTGGLEHRHLTSKTDRYIYIKKRSKS